MWQKHEKGRLVYIYAMGCAYDTKRPEPRPDQAYSASGDKRGQRPLPLLKDDFDKFVQMVSNLVTADNQHYVCVLVGRARRQGSGLLVEAGVSAEQQVLQAFRTETSTWRDMKF